MALIEEGRVCIKKLGRDAGSKAVITKVIDGSFVNIISSVRPKERKCNVLHLEFLSDKVSLSDKSQLAKVLEIDVAKLKA
jgi:large subunit ribosomal protein L14e